MISECFYFTGKNRFNFCKLKKRTSFNKGEKNTQEKSYADAALSGQQVAFKPQMIKLRSNL